MSRTKTQREMALVIKTHQNNNKKHINFFWGGTGTYQFILEERPILLLCFFTP
jgi:hypothetical protein